jgi:hypothetical protein
MGPGIVLRNAGAPPQELVAAADLHTHVTHVGEGNITCDSCDDRGPGTVLRNAGAPLQELVAAAHLQTHVTHVGEGDITCDSCDDRGPGTVLNNAGAPLQELGAAVLGVGEDLKEAELVDVLAPRR